MNNQIISQVLGQLTQEENIDDWWKSIAIEIPFFDNDKLTITFMDCEPDHDKMFIEEADQALTNFFKLNSSNKNSLSELAYKNCIDFLNEIEYDDADELLRGITNKNDIWNMRPGSCLTNQLLLKLYPQIF